MPNTNAQNAVKIANLTKEAKEAAHGRGMGGDRTEQGDNITLQRGTSPTYALKRLCPRTPARYVRRPTGSQS